jgi:membrane protease YdiL (CAAX protease family)
MQTVEYLNLGLVALGGAILMTCVAVVTARGRWRSVLSVVPVRTHHLDLVHVGVILLIWLIAAQALTYASSFFAAPAGLSPDEWQGTSTAPGLCGVVVQSAAKAVAAVMLILLAASVVERGLDGFGLTRNRLVRDVAWGGIGYLVVWSVCFGMAQIVVLIAGPPRQHAVMNLVHSAAVPRWGVICLWLSAVLVSPVAEELFFRGLLQTVFRGYLDRPWLAIGVASLAFGMVHWSQPQYVVPLTLLGLALGYLYEHTGSLVGPVILHILFNSRTMVFDAMTRHV